ncbi:MAG: Kae1-associated kinase Bud32 [Candidatus Nezhaarchaeales archaeon]
MKSKFHGEKSNDVKGGSFLLKKGAEAYLYLEDWYGLKVIAKRRVIKSYRVPSLDLELRRYRTIHEAQLISSAKTLGIPVPTIYEVNIPETTIVMEYIPGLTLKQLITTCDEHWRLQLFKEVGSLIAKLHLNGIVHGDLTTSNMILSDTNRKVFLIDFGLGEYSKSIEARGVDLHLMLRALESTHPTVARKCFDYVMQGYQEVAADLAPLVLKRVQDIRRRGRYVAR